jgi:hypothetical protein
MRYLSLLVALLLSTFAWADGGPPGGASGTIQYNNAGQFGGETFVSLFPTLVNGDCLSNNGSTLNWATCGSGGSSAFNAITSGTNSTATMTVGTGGTLTVSGSGVNNSNEVNGATVPASESVLASNSSSQLIAATTVTYLVDTGTTFTLGSGTGACATSSTLVGGTATGSFVCTGTGGASTQIINLPSAPNQWFCASVDQTTTADTFKQTANTTATVTLSGTIAANDKIFFSCTGS